MSEVFQGGLWDFVKKDKPIPTKVASPSDKCIHEAIPETFRTHPEDIRFKWGDGEAIVQCPKCKRGVHLSRSRDDDGNYKVNMILTLEYARYTPDGRFISYESFIKDEPEEDKEEGEKEDADSSDESEDTAE